MKTKLELINTLMAHWAGAIGFVAQLKTENYKLITTAAGGCA